MKIAIIGAGNAATVLGRLFLRKNHQVVHVFNRNLEKAKFLARELGCSFGNLDEAGKIVTNIYVIAVSDNAIAEIATQLNLGDNLIVHTAGAVSKELLKTASSNYGVLYPLQSLRKELEIIPEIPFLIDANTPENILKLEELAGSLSPDVKIMDDESRLKMHVGAAFVNNFVNHIYALTADYCQKEKLDFKLLLPLILSTAERLKTAAPKDIQTGPAVRNDTNTIDKHLKVLDAYTEYKNLYEQLTASIIDFNKKQ